MMITHNMVIPITDLALFFLNIKQTKSFIMLLQNLTQYIWFILFLFLDFMQIVCLRLMATAATYVCK